ncbi:NUDIX hydrolase domain-like protein [Aspergillus crustosus]
MTVTSNQTFTVAPHLQEYNLPFATFRANNPKYTHFIGGGLIFSRGASTPQNQTKKDNEITNGKEDGEKESLRILLIQRALDDSFPGEWEGPGGLCEESDETLLAGVSREVFEETGLHVSHFVELVGKDEWVRVKPASVISAVKFTFLVEVHEAVPVSESSDGDGVPADRLDDGGVVPGLKKRWEELVKLDPAEHQAFEWVGEEEIGREGGRIQPNGRQESTILEGFRILKGGVRSE